MPQPSDTAIHFPRIVARAEWQKARDALLVKEKEATHARDALAAERRRLPMVRVDKEYVFTGAQGTLSLRDCFEGRRQLLLYHFMFAPTVPGWPAAGCVGCSMMTDQFGHIAHFHARDTSLCLVSRAPLENIQAFASRMGWTYPWYSSAGTSFNEDFGLTTSRGENYGLSVFIHDDHDVYHTYQTRGRGIEGLNIWTFLDLTPLGRQEEWEDAPLGGARTPPYVWWRRHDEYGTSNWQRDGTQA